jgi:RNA 2',3'-cyclic 3'-phosphodiesterase
MQKTVRAFIAFDIPGYIVKVIQELQADLKSRGLSAKWVKPENIHLTLKFLGDTPQGRLEAVCRKLDDVFKEQRPVSLCAKGVGVFPTIKRPRIFWFGLGGESNRLFEIKHQIENALASIDFPRENKMYKAHLTLARFKGAINKRPIEQAMEYFADFQTDAFSVDQCILYQSRLTPSGPIYTALHKAPLIAV